LNEFFMGTAVQFRGIPAILSAYDMRGAEVWAVFVNKDLSMKGTGHDELKSYLEMMAKHGSDAIYILKVYEDLDDPKLVKDRTPADGAFGFKLHEYDGAMGSVSGAYQERLKLEERIKKLEAGDEDEDKSIGGRIGNALLGLLEEPTQLVELIGAIRGMMQPAAPVPAMIGNVMQYAPAKAVQTPRPAEQIQTPPVQSQVMTDDEKILRLQKSLDTLEKNDPNVIPHLEKLAKMSEEDPATFKFLISMLDKS
jgi:hypothetical protein